MLNTITSQHCVLSLMLGLEFGDSLCHSPEFLGVWMILQQNYLGIFFFKIIQLLGLVPRIMIQGTEGSVFLHSSPDGLNVEPSIVTAA